MKVEYVRLLTPGKFIRRYEDCSFSLFEVVTGCEGHTWGVSTYPTGGHKIFMESLSRSLLVISNFRGTGDNGHVIIFLADDNQLGYLFVTDNLSDDYEPGLEIIA